jgi:iron-sulfur cluster repair protein YtfE (RIC family)
LHPARRAPGLYELSRIDWCHGGQHAACRAVLIDEHDVAAFEHDEHEQQLGPQWKRDDVARQIDVVTEHDLTELANGARDPHAYKADIAK